MVYIKCYRLIICVFLDIGCTFDLDMCDYQITGEDGFTFMRQKGESFQNGEQDGPKEDENGSATAYFVYINSVQIPAKDIAIAEIQIPMIQAKDHMLECFHFWFSMKVTLN